MSESSRDQKLRPASPLAAADVDHDTVAERLRRAHRAIETARATRPAAPLRELIDEARVELGLTQAEVTWIHWTLAPDEVAIQPKQPDAH